MDNIAGFYPVHGSSILSRRTNITLYNMNDHDQQNLNFLLNVEQDTLAHWWEQCTEDDRQYARELLIEHSHVLVEKELSMMSIYPDAVRVIDQVQ